MDPAALTALGLGDALCSRPLLLRRSSYTDLPSGTTNNAQHSLPAFVFETLCADSGAPCKALRLCTWNVLAPSYALKKSFPDVDPEWLRSSHRQPRVNMALKRLGADALCLQEVERPEEWRVRLSGLGYEMAFAQRPGRADGCLLAWQKMRLRCVGDLAISFDDVLEEEQPSLPSAVFARFGRKNVALVAELESVDGCSAEPFRFLLATTHLYWGSDHEDVRAWQLQVLLERAKQRFAPCQDQRLPPLALCGDLNMLPWGLGYRLLRSGHLELPRRYRNVERFLVDRDISKAARPLRLLGLDVAVEHVEEHRSRHEGCGELPVLERSLREGRVLISASRKLVARADSTSAYFIDARQFERSLASLCVDLSVELLPERFFTRCVKCNGLVRSSRFPRLQHRAARWMVHCSPGGVLPLADTDHERDRAQAFGAPEGVPLFTCSRCGQVYWFSHDASSASARARLQVDSLITLIEEMKERLPKEAEEQLQARSCSSRFLRDGGGCLDLGCKLQSAYEDLEFETGKCANKEEEAVTNSKYGFHGCIDYMWLSEGLHARRRSRLQLPRLGELKKVLNHAKPLPSLVTADWPSDHWPLAVDLELP